MGGGGGIQQAQKLKQNKSSADVLLPEPKIHGHDQERGGGVCLCIIGCVLAVCLNPVQQPGLHIIIM